MAATSSPPERPATTEELLAWLLRNGRRDRLCRELAALSGASAALVEDAVQEACLLAATPGRCRGRSEGEVFNWLRATTLSKIRDLRRRAYERHETPVGLACSARDVALAAATERQALDRERERELLGLARLALTRMTTRERHVVALHSHRVRGGEIAQRLDTSERGVKRLKENAYRRARATLVEAAGGGCNAGEQLVSRLSFGTAAEAEQVQALAHLDKCPDCQSLYRRLEAMHDKIAALLPLPAATQPDPALLARALEKTTAAVGHVKQQLAEIAGQAKQQAAASYTRAVEYTPLASLRPGAAAGAIAGCLALGGGAAGYCLDQNVNPVTGLVDAIHNPVPTRTEAASQEPRERKPAADQPPDPPVVPAAPPATPAPTQATDPQPVATPVPPPAPEPATPPEPAPTPTPPAVQFGEPTNPAPAAPAQAAQPAPAPAPASGGTDLYGP